jgi:hypothetical protein
MGRMTWAELRRIPLISLPADNTIQQIVDEQL